MTKPARTRFRHWSLVIRISSFSSADWGPGSAPSAPPRLPAGPAAARNRPGSERSAGSYNRLSSWLLLPCGMAVRVGAGGGVRQQGGRLVAVRAPVLFQDHLIRVQPGG